jgi:hypothetical protein
MSKQFTILDRITVPTPCTADWDAMTGNEEVRFCEHCSKHVNNLSEMTRKQALELVSRSKGQLCVRYYRRPDNTIQTRTAPPAPLHQIKRRVSRLAAGAFTAAISLCSTVAAQTQTNPPATSNYTVPLDAARSLSQGGGNAALAGTVTDPQGAVVPAANVTLTNEDTKQEQTATTSDEGVYNFQGLEAGSYTLKVNSPGFSSSETTNIAIQTFESRRADTTLSVGGVMSGDMVIVVSADEPLVKAASENDLAKVKELIAAGVDANRRDKNTDSTALDEAVANGNREIGRVLLDVGVDVNARGNRRQSALMRIDEDATAELILDLVRAGARVNLKDEDGDTALIIAAQWNEPEILKTLLDAGARVNAKNHEGQTALMKAASEGNLESVKLLIAAGSDINRRAADGDTALSQALENEHTEVVEFLKAHNAMEFAKLEPEEK